jgi:hemerythrin
VDAAQAYLRMARQSGANNEKEKLKAELLQELEQRQQKKGWLARLLSR